MSMSTEEKIRHYQRSIDRSLTDKERLLHCIEILSKLPVTVQHLQITGVGRTVNALRKIEDGVGEAAKRLVAKWKIMVANTDTSDEEDEACVPDVPESYESPDCDSEPDITVKQNRKNSSDNLPEALMQSSDSPPMDIDVGTPPSTPPTTSNNDNKALVSDDEDEPRKHYMSKPSSYASKSLYPRSPSKDKSSKQDCNSKASKDKHTNSKDNYESSKASKHSKDLEISDHKKKEKNKMKSESSHSSSGKDKKYLEEKKRKHYSSSSDEETDRKRKKSENEEQDEDNDEENNFVIYDEKSSEEEDEQEDKQEDDEENDREENDDEKEKYCKKAKKFSSDSQSRDKESSLKGASHSDKIKSKEKNRSSSSNSKTKSHEKRTSSKVDEQGKDEKQKSDEHHSRESSKSKSSHSSSSSKDRSKDKDKHTKDKLKESVSKNRKDEKDKSKSKDDRGKCKDNKEHKERKDHKEHKKSKESKEDKELKDNNDQKEKKKVKKSTSGDGGIDCNSGTSFADALGMCTMPPPSKKKKENVSLSLPKPSKAEQPNPSTSTPSSSKSSPYKLKNECPNSPETLPLLSPNVKLEPLSRINEEVDLASTLPEPSPHYKPLPHLNHTQRRLNEDQMLSQVIYAKNQRTKVYSGNKTGYTNVPTLYELCIRVLIENIDALEFTGGVPYYIIKPVLERATPDQLFILEHHNPYLIEESDSLWQFHCNKDFRTKQREEMESWREMYMRCLDEREAKLKALTANIKQSIDKSLPVRSTKLAYVDNVVKPPRSVLRKQAKYGTANTTTNASDLKKKLITGTAGASNSSSGSSSSSGPPAERIIVPPPTTARIRPSTSSTMKKTKAPLMAKALQAIKGRYKR